MSNTVHVKNISGETTEKEVRDFFSFCGKISSLSVTSETSEKSGPQSATVTFEKETAAKTALLLDNTQLGPSQVHVTSAQSLEELSGGSKSGESKDGDDLSQEDKPRSRVVAEMLAHGYVIGDNAIQRALALDQQHGISTRFTNVLSQFDQRFKATETAQGLDQKYNLTQRATDGWKSLYSYFDKAQETPTGQRLRAFYDQGQKQVLDVHNEARHLAALKQGKDPKDLGTGQTAAATGSTGTSDLGKTLEDTKNAAADKAEQTKNAAVEKATEAKDAAAKTVDDATKKA